jgi:tetratricopeptide (TPR) repeat protein
MTTGSFGFGWVRLATSGIDVRTADGQKTDEVNYAQQLFLFSYAKQLKDYLSLGLSVKINSFALGNVNDTGVGADFGVLFRPEFDSSFLRDIAFGANIQNIVSPKHRLRSESQPAPLNFKLGFAKPIYMGEGLNSLRVLFDLNKSEKASSTFHVGAEYAFQNVAHIRAGMNDSQLAFGAGAVYRSFQLDYNYGKFYDAVDFGNSHRFSLTIEFGKGKQELIRLSQERREREMRIQVVNQIWFERETEFYNTMESGRDKYYSADYLGAYVAFSKAEEAANALFEAATDLRAANNGDQEAVMRVQTANQALDEVQTMLQLAEAKDDSTRKAEQEAIVLREKSSAIEKELMDFILLHKDRGNEFFKSGQFNRAISEWQLAYNQIERSDVRTDLVADVKMQLGLNIQTAKEQIEGNIDETIKRAKSYARREQYVTAIEELNKVAGSGSDTENKIVEDLRRSYQNQLSFEQNFQEGLRLYTRKEYQNAKEAFDRALRNKPGNKEAREYSDKAYARSIATVQDMPDDIKRKYVRARVLYREKNYQEALGLLEQCLEAQPYNQRFLTLYDVIVERLNR